ncbi:MAG: putative Glycosyl transferase, group 1 family [Candidatus Saccharibacteria bacterium]|nr:putative Glycosyl transferase, group 1 family [Candidatus Saccharibacteria bacterium]
MLGWELPPHNSGGLGVACYHMSKALALSGATIDFVVPYKASHPDIDFMKIHPATNLSPLHRFGMGAYDSNAVKEVIGESADPNQAVDIRSIQRRYIKHVEKMVALKVPDVIHAHDWLTMEAGVRAKELTDAPLIVHVHATEFDRAGSKFGNPLIHDIEYNGLMMADRILAVSQITKDIIVSRYNIPADKVEVVHNAIDVDSLNDGYEYDHRTYRYLEHLKGEGYTVISTVTRFALQKGLDHLVRAFAMATNKYDRLVLLLAGDGEQRNELIALASELGISDKVFFTGFVRGKQWRDAYSVSDIFVMSSVSEPFGLTALEAAHHDNALIITKQSGVGEVLNSIFRYDFWDTTRLADQIVGIATSEALASSLKHNVTHEYTRFSWHDVAQKCMRAYETAPVGVLV